MSFREKYTDIPSNRVEPIKHHNTFIGFRDDSGNHAIGEYLHSTESILISNDTDTEDESEFEIPNGKINRLPETSSVGVQVNTFQNRRFVLH